VNEEEIARELRKAAQEFNGALEAAKTKGLTVYWEVDGDHYGPWDSIEVREITKVTTY